MTALGGGSMSDESFAILTAILAAPYAAFQTDSLDDPDSSSAASVRSQEGEAIDRAMALEEAASALRSLERGWNVASSCFMYPRIRGVGVGSGIFVAVTDDGDFFSKVMHGGRKERNLRASSS